MYMYTTTQLLIEEILIPLWLLLVVSIQLNVPRKDYMHFMEIHKEVSMPENTFIMHILSTIYYCTNLKAK